MRFLAALMFVAAGALVARPAPAAIETDPTALYATMKKAYDLGNAHHWRFADERYYLSAIFDAGRAYSLFRGSSDPNYAEVALLAVDIATELHYDPLTSDDAASWYVREACEYVVAHSDQRRVAAATALMTKVEQSESNPNEAARVAVEDGVANVEAFPHDSDALVEQIVAEVRAYNVTRDNGYRSAILKHATNPALPLSRVPDAENAELFRIAEWAGGNDQSFSEEDRANAKVVLDRRKHTPDLQVIGHVRVLPYQLRMTRTAPADEYFGHLKMSPIGVHNQMAHLRMYLDAGWGSRMSSEALNVANAIVDWQRQYPHDITLPQQIYDMYKLLVRVDSEGARAEAERFKSLLLIQYNNTSQARELAAS